jgi:hypothetical protein
MSAPKPPPRVAKKAPPPKKDAEPPRQAAAPSTAPPNEMPFVPVMQAAANADAVLNNIMAREMVSPSGKIDSASENLELLQTLAVGLSKGDIATVKDALTRKGTHQVEKAQIIDAVLNEDNFERIANWMVIRHNTERVIKRCSQRGDMTTSEAIVFWRTSHDALGECFARLEKTKPIDSSSVVEKVDIQVKEGEQAIKDKWAATSPQGREIIRKKLHKVKKALAAAAKAQAKS